MASSYYSFKLFIRRLSLFLVCFLSAVSCFKDASQLPPMDNLVSFKIENDLGNPLLKVRTNFPSKFNNKGKAKEYKYGADNELFNDRVVIDNFYEFLFLLNQEYPDPYIELITLVDKKEEIICRILLNDCKDLVSTNVYNQMNHNILALQTERVGVRAVYFSINASSMIERYQELNQQ